MAGQKRLAPGWRRGGVHQAVAGIAALMVLGMLACPGVASTGQGHDWPASGGAPAHDWRVGWVAPAEVGSPVALALAAPLQGGPVACGEGHLYVLVANQLVRLDPDEGLVWATTVGRADNRGLALGPGPQGDLQVYVATADPRMVRAYAASSGALLWHQFLGTVPLGPPAVHPGTGALLVGCEDGRLRGYSPSGGKLFEAALGSQVRSRPAIGPSGNVYVLPRGGALIALTPAGGELWRKVLGSTAAHSAAVGPDERIYFSDDSGRAWCVDPTGTTVYQVTIGNVAGPPAVDDAGYAYYVTSSGGIVKLTPGGVAALLADLPLTEAATGRLAVDGAGNLVWAAAGLAGMVNSTGGALWLTELAGPVVDLVLPIAGVVAVSSENGSVLLVGQDAVPQPGTDPDQIPAWQPVLQLSEVAGSNGWHNTPLQVWLAPDGGPPAAGVTVALDLAAGDDQWSVQLLVDAPPVTLAVEGEVLVRWRTTWPGGAMLSGEWVSVLVDTVPPAVSVAHPLEGAGLPLGAALRPEVSAGDATSGLDIVETTLNGVPFHTSCYPGPGQHQLQVRATDRAGNVSEVLRSFTISQRCSAICLNPVLSGPRLTAFIPPWSRWVTVMVRVPAALAAAGEPEQVSFAGVPGVLIGRLPAPLSSSLRSYLFRFDRDGVGQALSDLAGPSQLPGRLHRLDVPMSWYCGEEACGAAATVLFRP